MKNAFRNKKSHFTAKRRILEKKFIKTTNPFMVILHTWDLFGTPIVNVWAEKIIFHQKCFLK